MMADMITGIRDRSPSSIQVAQIPIKQPFLNILWLIILLGISIAYIHSPLTFSNMYLLGITEIINALNKLGESGKEAIRAWEKNKERSK